VLVRALFKAASASARRKRAAIFLSRFEIGPETKILDLGSEDGSNIAGILKSTGAVPSNVFIADINPAAVARGHERYGFTAVTLDEAGTLPFPDQFFDIVFCSSVIEHVTVSKQEVWQLKSGAVFRSKAAARQRDFANEILRVGKQYFVQTPYSLYPIESHSWLPFAGYLPRPLLIPVLKIMNRIWIKATSPDWYLLNRKELSDLFPGAQIIDEKSFGLTKSIMAVSNRRDGHAR
jgi:SAM-dependent methyltransferase